MPPQNKGKGGGKGFGKGGGKGGRDGGKGQGKGGGHGPPPGCMFSKNGKIIPAPGPLFKTITWDMVKMDNHTLEGKTGSIDYESKHLKNYYDNVKQSKMWGAQGQPVLSREYERKAKSLMAGEFSESEIPVKSEHFIRPTRGTRTNPRVAQGSSCFVICPECLGYSGTHKFSCPCYVSKTGFAQFWDIAALDEE